MKKKCAKCSKEVDSSELNYAGKCRECKRKEDSYSSSSSPSPGIGDMLGSGLPGGYDFDFTTPL